MPAGRVSPYDIGPTPSWRNLRYPRAQIPADAVAVRVIAEDLSLSQGDWVAVTPPRVPEVRSVQEYVGSRAAGADGLGGRAWPSRASSRCCTPTASPRSPKFRITPDYNAKLQTPTRWQDGLNGGLLGITDLLLRAQ